MPIDENEGLAAERTAMLETLEVLDTTEWDTPSLCEGWRVRDVASHVALAVTIPPAALLFGLVRARGDINRFMARYVPKRGSRPVAEILGEFRTMAGSASIPVTTKRVDVALDAFVHHHDIALPLGRNVPTDGDRMRWLADGMVAAGKPILSAPRVSGLRLVATDIDWHHGTGPEVTGPVAALMLAGCGRRALDSELSGEGLRTLQTR